MGSGLAWSPQRKGDMSRRVTNTNYLFQCNITYYLLLITYLLLLIITHYLLLINSSLIFEWSIVHHPPPQRPVSHPATATVPPSRTQHARSTHGRTDARTHGCLHTVTLSSHIGFQYPGNHRFRPVFEPSTRRFHWRPQPCYIYLRM